MPPRRCWTSSTHATRSVASPPKPKLSTASPQLYSYTYDLAGRLTGVMSNGVTIATYAYDSNGNRTSFTGPGGTLNGTYDAQDRLLQYGANTYTYTANGELLTKTNGGQTTNYQYDVLGNLMAVTLPNGTQVAYLVDGQNRRVGKQVNGVLTQSFLYDGQLRPAAELDGSGNVVSRFVFATRINVPDYMVKNGVTYRLILDHLGSPRLVVNVATGKSSSEWTMTSSGRVLADTNSGFQPFGFAGGLYYPDTGLVRFGARDYDAETGRWTAKDPIRFASGYANMYVYVQNNPVNMIDPLGLNGYDTVADAALSALRESLKRQTPNGWEWGGLIYFDPKDWKYHYTDPRTDKKRDSVSIGDKNSCPTGTKTVAEYHVHSPYPPNLPPGATKGEDYFSFQDKEANWEGKWEGESYLATPNGAFQVYDFKTNKEYIIDPNAFP